MSNGRQIGLSGEFDFKEHVGHTVKVTGQQEGPAFAVTNLEHLSATCDADAASAGVPTADAEVHQNGVQEQADITAPASQDPAAVAQAQVATTTNDAAVNARDRAAIVESESAERSAEISGARSIAQNDTPHQTPSDLDPRVTVDPRSDVEPRVDVDVDPKTQAEQDHDVIQGHDAGVTADNQSNKKSDRKTTAAIRKSIVKDDSLSTYGHNVKIITQDGRVTLRGPVRTAAEKATIAAKAEKVVGAGAVVDQMTVEPDTDDAPNQRTNKEK